MANLNSFRDLRVYQELRSLHLAVHEESLRFPQFEAAYEACDKMLERLHQRLSEWRGTTRTGYEVREEASRYDVHGPAGEWETVARISADVMAEFAIPIPPPSTLHLPPGT